MPLMSSIVTYTLGNRMEHEGYPHGLLWFEHTYGIESVQSLDLK